MRYMSFMLTRPQFLDRTKHVTRRIGWDHVKVGDVLMGCEKCMGLRKGERTVKLGPIRITDKRREPLNAITQEDCILEGFPALTPDDFVFMFCLTHKGCKPKTTITRIAYEYIDENIDGIDGEGRAP